MAKEQRRERLIAGFLISAIICLCHPVAAGEPVGDLNNCALELGLSFKKQRVLPFPSDYSLGEVEIEDWPQTAQGREMRGAARGTIVVPPGKLTKFVPAGRFYKNPSIIKTLPADGFDSILMAAVSLDDSEDGMCDRALAFVGHLKGLVELQLDKSDATDAGARHAQELPNLQRITASSAAIEGKCLSQFSGLKHLRQIRLPRNPLQDENLKYLGALPQLQYLNFERCGISDEGIKNLANCSKLISLNIGDNPRITDQSIQYLLALKKLRYLVLNGTAITAKGAMQLKGLPLRVFSIQPTNCTPGQLAELRRAFPNCSIAGPGGKARAVDSETRTLFAPLH